MFWRNNISSSYSGYCDTLRMNAAIRQNHTEISPIPFPFQLSFKYTKFPPPNTNFSHNFEPIYKVSVWVIFHVCADLALLKMLEKYFLTIIVDVEINILSNIFYKFSRFSSHLC